MPVLRSASDSIQMSINSPVAPPRPKRMSGELEALKAEVQAMRAEMKEYKKKTTEQITGFIKQATLDQALADFNKRLTDLETNVRVDNGLFNRRLTDLEEKMENYEKRFHFDPEVTIIAKDVPFNPAENPVDVADKLIRDGLRIVDVPVIRAKRLESRVQNKPGLLKIEVKDLDAKKKLLKHKQSLKNSQQYERVYVRSSKSHVERLLELNTNMLLQELPNGHRFRLTANGRLLKDDGYQTRNNNNHGQRPWGPPQNGPPPAGPPMYGPPPTGPPMFGPQMHGPPPPSMRGPPNKGYH